MADKTIDLTEGADTPGSEARLAQAVRDAAWAGARTLITVDNQVVAFVGTPDDLEVIRLYEH